MKIPGVTILADPHPERIVSMRMDGATARRALSVGVALRTHDYGGRAIVPTKEISFSIDEDGGGLGFTISPSMARSLVERIIEMCNVIEKPN